MPSVVREIGSKRYLRYNRSKLLSILAYSRKSSFDFPSIIAQRNFKEANKALKAKIVSYYAAKHEGFMSIAEKLDESEIKNLSSQVSTARREFKVKPASWFKVEDAFTILEILCRYGGAKVLDPFHGWGARLCAAKMLGLPYVGVDANPLLHAELKAVFPDSSLIEANAFNIDYDALDFDCVFTCPPYWKCEDYGYRISYPQTYSQFLIQLCDLFERLSGKAKFQAVSLEAFHYKKRSYPFDTDFVAEMTRRGFMVHEHVYRLMNRSFNKDVRPLKVFVLFR